MYAYTVVKPESEDKTDEVGFDRERMEQAFATPTIDIPEGLSPKELEAFILKHAD